MSGVSNSNVWKAGKRRTQSEENSIEILTAIDAHMTSAWDVENFISRVFIAHCEK
jgi:hypothetical protein